MWIYEVLVVRCVYGGLQAYMYVQGDVGVCVNVFGMACKYLV